MATMAIEGGQIRYEVYGSGFPVLCFAPGALASELLFWRSSPRNPGQTPGWMDPSTALAPHFKVIVMDQRNAGQSRGPVGHGDGWELYARDHLALLDHLGVDRCHVLGACIGVSFALKLAEQAPARIASLALMQPIGRVPENVDYTRKSLAEKWGPSILENNPLLDPEVVRAFGQRLFGPDFVHSVTREFVRNCKVPMLIMPGNEVAHPKAMADELLQLAPRGEYLTFWKGEGRENSVPVIRDFLQRNTPTLATSGNRG